MKRGKDLVFASQETRRILGMVRLNLPDAQVARACGCTEAHVSDLRAAYGELGPLLIEVALPRDLGARIEAEAERRGVRPADMIAAELAVLAKREGWA